MSAFWKWAIMLHAEHLILNARLPDANFNKKSNNAKKGQTLFAVLPFLFRKNKYLITRIFKKFSSKSRLNLAWNYTRVLIFPDFSWFLKFHTLGKMLACWSIGSFSLHADPSAALAGMLIHRQLSARVSPIYYCTYDQNHKSPSTSTYLSHFYREDA